MDVSDKGWWATGYDDTMMRRCNMLQRETFSGVPARVYMFL